MTGIATLTIVWSSAPRNSASMIAPRISSFCRCSIRTAGADPSPVTGMASIVAPP
jgi:hypothetical protein